MLQPFKAKGILSRRLRQPKGDACLSSNNYRDYLTDQEGRIYLAACSHAPVSKRLLLALERYEHDMLEFGNPWDLWLEKIASATKLFAKLIGASQEEVFPSFSVSSALSSVLSSLRYDGRRGIVVSDMEYPTTNFIFLAQQRYGAKITTLRSSGYRLSTDQYSRAVDRSTLLTSAIHVSSLNGFRQNIREICDIAHKAGSLFYTDAYQSLGTIPVDVSKDDVDFLAGGNLKYLMGLPGMAFMYVRRELIGGLEPTNIGWFSQKDPFLFGAEKLDYAGTADRFQSGTLSIPSVYAAIEGMETILEMGVKNIERHVAKLTARAMALADECGLKTITPSDPGSRGAIVSFIVRRPHELELKLRERRVITSSRDIGLRIAPHFYNTMDEIDAAVGMIDAMKDY